MQVSWFDPLYSRQWCSDHICFSIQPTLSPEVTKCTYIQCGILQNLCGTTCYSGPKVCCDGTLHQSEDGYQCCGKEYAQMTNQNDVCCGGKFHSFRQDYKCCNGRWV